MYAHETSRAILLIAETQISNFREQSGSVGSANVVTLMQASWPRSVCRNRMQSSYLEWVAYGHTGLEGLAKRAQLLDYQGWLTSAILINSHLSGAGRSKLVPHCFSESSSICERIAFWRNWRFGLAPPLRLKFCPLGVHLDTLSSVLSRMSKFERRKLPGNSELKILNRMVCPQNDYLHSWGRKHCQPTLALTVGS